LRDNAALLALELAFRLLILPKQYGHHGEAFMQFCRLYTGTDGQSHFEDLDQREGADEFMKAHEVKALVFKNDFNRADLHAWHTAPRRQWCITLSGSVEIGIGDGTVRVFEPGDVFLAEDITGQGHTAVPKNWVRAFIYLE
jgi:hypothetical protein